MHLKLDDEIFRIESRIASRKVALATESREAGQRTLRQLASPTALAAALALGFCAGSAGRRRKKDDNEKVKAGSILGALMTGALWLIRAQFGSPLGFAHAVMDRIAPSVPSRPPRDPAR